MSCDKGAISTPQSKERMGNTSKYAHPLFLFIGTKLDPLWQEIGGCSKRYIPNYPEPTKYYYLLTTNL